MNLFDYKRIAEGYANDRPGAHGLVMGKIREELQLRGKLTRGLDVGCGSGSSTVALKQICDEVIGIEESVEMIRVAKRKHWDAKMDFLKCKAEEAPFQEDFFDIVTAAGSVPWIDPRAFLPLMSRQIKKNGWFII